MSEEEEDKLVAESAQRDLLPHLMEFMGRPLTSVEVERIVNDVNEWASSRRARGIPFPRIVAIVLERRGHIVLSRRDADHKRIQATLKSIIAKFPDITADELAPAIRRAYPHYTPEL